MPVVRVVREGFTGAYDEPVELLAAGGSQTIRLTKDMHFEGSGYGIQNNIDWPADSTLDFDLNGYTLYACEGEVNTVGTIVTFSGVHGPGNMGHAAILCPGSPDYTEDFPGLFGFNPNGKILPTIRIFGPGQIFAGNGPALSYSDCVRVDVPFEISNCTIECDIEDGRPIVGDRNCYAHHLMIRHYGRVSNRHSIRAAINFGQDGKAHDNDITTTNQCGIFPVFRGDIYDNVIAMDCATTNSYGLMLTENQATDNRFDHNTVTAVSGQGMRLAREGSIATDITLDANRPGTVENPVTTTHGLKLEANNKGTYVRGLRAISRGNQQGGSGSGLNCGLSESFGVIPSGNLVEESEFEITGDHDSSRNGALFCVANLYGRSLTIKNCVFRTNHHCVHLENENADLKVHDSYFVATGGQPFISFYDFQKSSVNSRFVDCVYIGCDPRTRTLLVPTPPNARDIDYHIDWTIRLPGAAGLPVTVTDAHGTVLVDRQEVDPSLERVEASEYSYARDPAVVETVVEHSPIFVSIGAESYHLELNKPTTINRGVLPLGVLASVA